MFKVKNLVVLIGLTALLAFAVACSNGEAATTPDTSSPAAPSAQPGATAASAPAPVVSAPAPAPVAPAIEPAPAPPAPAVAPVRPAASPATREPSSYQGAPLIQVGNSQAGIWVSGRGTVSLEPDLAVVNVGVETQARTVAEARDQAARAMDAIVAAVRARGLTERDVQTRSFNIFPQYDYQEITELGRRTSRRVLVGYMVNNTAAIKIRALDAVGDIIDEVANAGGDATRINGVQFTVEDPAPFLVDLRAAAVNDALAKAQHFASLTGVSLGRLVFIGESGGRTPIVQQDFGIERAFAAAAPAPATSISGGELELVLNVQAAFDIQ